jgi:O-antigen/teichoic acid export membrane protein
MDDLGKFLRSTATYAAVPATLALIALVLFPGQVLRIAFGAEYAAASTIVLVMIVGHVVLVLSGNPPYILTMTGQQRIVLIVNLGAAIVMVVLGTLGALTYGATGLAAGSSASLIVQHGLLWWLARRKLGLWTHVGRPILPTR